MSMTAFTIYESSGLLQQGYPRCDSMGTVETFRLRSAVRWLFAVALVGVVACHYFSGEYDFEGQMIAAGIGFFELVAGSGARCSACKQRLQKEIGNGWK